MKNENRRPLIRKSYSFWGILKLIFSRFTSGKASAELCIPGVAGTIEFRSVSSKRETGKPVALTDDIKEEKILAAMKANDLRGFGGAGFPMADKLDTVIRSGKVERVLIINGVECDPGLYHDKWLLENKQKELERISCLLKKAFNLSGIYLAKKAGTPAVHMEGVTSVDVPDTYPAGEETRLVKWLLDVECEDGIYPAEMGIWVQNVQSLLILHSVLSGTAPLRYITMTDLDRKQATVVECDIDTPISELSVKVFGQIDRLYLGGGIMQAFPANGEKSLDSSINLIATGIAADFSDKDCRHCGQCTLYCPAGLPVEEIVAEISETGTASEDKKEKCSRCGACSFLCPAGKDVCSIIASV